MSKTDKVLVLGIDGMDPRLTKHYLDQGEMPKLKEFLERGSAREDLMLLGGIPTITPPMWTSLSTGAYPMTHGITDFWGQHPTKLDTLQYYLDSRICKAEQMWNVTAEAGKKTLVFHWPGASWPPTTDSENLFVVDGTNPEGICMGTGQIEHEYIAIARKDIEQVTFKKKVGKTQMMCVVEDIEMPDDVASIQEQCISPDITLVDLLGHNGPKDEGSVLTSIIFDASLSSIKPAEKWKIDIPSDALEITILFSGGLVRRPGLITKGANGNYDKLSLYKNKNTEEPIITMEKGEFVQGVVDEAIRGDKTYEVARNMRLLQLAEDGSEMRMWISAAIDTHDDTVFHPKSLHKELIENVGYPMPASNVGAYDEELIFDCMEENWMRTMEWWADAIQYLINAHGIEVVFSQIHNDDAEKHNFISMMRDGYCKMPLPMETYERAMLNIYKQNDYYIGRFLPLLDEGWTILLVSDHGLVASECGQSSYYSGMGVDATFMREWGYTEVKYDENGNPLPEVDWSKTKAVCSRQNCVYINLKGRWDTGIVEPEDYEALCDEIIAKFLSVRDEKGRNVIALALKNRDAVLLGLGGEDTGDIIVVQAEYNLFDHGESLPTAYGLGHFSMSPIFAAAGKGIKQGYTTSRYIRIVDIAPTVAELLGLKKPAQCEGAPIYQIFEE